MGKGDQRSRRGKIWRGTFGKRRPKKSKVVTTAAAPSEAPAARASKKESETAARKPRKADQSLVGS
jgi:ribosomal small subunit protein bTHX